MSALKTIVAGAGGRMGRANIAAVHQADGLILTGALDREGADTIGKDANALAGFEPSGVLISTDAEALIKQADVLIDFTAPAATTSFAALAAECGLVHVIGTTGCSQEDEAALHKAAEAGARIVKSGNMSLGVNLLAALAKKGAEALGVEFDAEILEMHHNQKVDAPSGTALLLGEAVAAGRGIDLKSQAVMSREGHTGARVPGTVGFATLRGGSVVGEHSVIFAGPGERVELRHVAQDRSLFAQGAVKAAIWAADKKNGYYTMADVLGLSS